MSNVIPKKTGKLSETRPVVLSPTTTPRGVAIGSLRPWRIAFTVRSAGVKIVTDMTESLILGRIAPESNTAPMIDLRPFGADDAGVSRKHLVVKADGEGVFVADLTSANGTLLNGKRLDAQTFYALHHQDRLTLGLLELDVELLIDPLS
jgi:hypothetical protein